VAAIRSVDGLIDALAEADLLSAGQMEALAMNLRAGFVEPAELAEDLVRRRWLTLYQAREIFQGRSAELALGPYVLVDRLGAGGIGQVFKARHRRLGRLDALKLLRPEHLANQRVLRSLWAEVRAASRLSHPNVVALYDAGKEGGRHFLAMEYVPGTDLGRLVLDGGPLSVNEACVCALQAARGLHHAHERGVVHRDVTPSNLLLAEGPGLVKVLDLGMALVRHPEGIRSRSEAGQALMGTPDYAAPEQARDSWAVDARADVYGLGSTLYFLLAGRPPVPGGSPAEKVLAHLRQEPAPLGELRPGLPAGLEEVVRRMMAKEPAERFPTLEEVARALAPFALDQDRLLRRR
jgi:serine/threonine protein kinase